MDEEDVVWLDDQIRGSQTIHQLHVHSGEDGDGIIRLEVLNQLIKFTYDLETDEDNEIRWSDYGYSNYSTKSTTF